MENEHEYSVNLTLTNQLQDEEKNYRSRTAKFIRRIPLFVSILISFILSNCKEETPVSDDDNMKYFPLVLADTMKITYNNLNYQINNRGNIVGGDLSNAGLWLATIQDGKPTADLIFQGAVPWSNYIAKSGTKKSGVYKFLSNGKKYLPDESVTSLGISLNPDGTVAIYGDEMYFSSFIGDSSLATVPIFSNPIKNVRVNATIFGYKRTDINDVVFIRYDITNLGKVELVMNAGYYSDTDIEAPSNSTGYDSLRGITYTYLPKPLRTPNKAIGFAFLDSPKMNGNQPIILSHRIVRKNDTSTFNERDFTKPQQVLWALNGLDNVGNPMINPVTNQITKFAFTGDPVAGTGWLDILVDTRNLLSTASFILMPNQTTTIIVALLCGEGETYKESISKLKEKLDIIRNHVELWKF